MSLLPRRDKGVYLVTMTGPNSFELEGEEYTGRPSIVGRKLNSGEKAYVGTSLKGGRRGTVIVSAVAGGKRTLPFYSRRTITFGIWQQSEGFPSLPGGPIAPNSLPGFGGSTLFTPGDIFNAGDTQRGNRIGWNGTALASSGDARILLYLSTRYNDGAETDPTEDAIGLRITAYNLTDDTSEEYTIDFPAPFVSDGGTEEEPSEWRRHRLGSFFYNPEDDLITVATPYGLYCLERLQDSQELSAWPVDSARPSKDLSFSCAWYWGLQHGWPQQADGTDGPVLRGLKRERNDKTWGEVWTKALTALTADITPGRIYQSGQTDRYNTAGGYYQDNLRALFLPAQRRWVVGLTVIEDDGWEVGNDLAGRAGIVISGLSADSGTVANQFTIEVDASDRLLIRPSLESEITAIAEAEWAERRALQLADPISDSALGSGFFPSEDYWPALSINAEAPDYGDVSDGGEPQDHVAYYDAVLAGDPVLPDSGTLRGICLPAPGLNEASLLDDYAIPESGRVNLRLGDDGNLYTVVFRAREAITGYTYNETEGMGTSTPGTTISWIPRLASDFGIPGDTFSCWNAHLEVPVPLHAVVEQVYESLLLCLSPALAEVSRTDISQKFIGIFDGGPDPQSVPLASWRNVWDWAQRGRVIWILRDGYTAATPGEALSDAYYKPVLEVRDAADPDTILHTIPLDDESSSAHYATEFGGIPRLLTGKQSAGDLEWAVATCYKAGNTQVLRVQLQADLGDTPDIYRDVQSGYLGGGTDFPVGSEFDHAVVFGDQLYWPSGFGPMQKST